MITAEVGLDELGMKDDEDVVAGDDENTSGPVDELEIVEWVVGSSGEVEEFFWLQMK